MRRELGVKKISLKWEGEVVKAIKKVENANSALLQNIFEQLADYESERVKFWCEVKDKMDEINITARYSGLRALYRPDSGEEAQGDKYTPITDEGQCPRYLDTNLQQRRGIYILLRLRLGELPTREKASRWNNYTYKY